MVCALSALALGCGPLEVEGSSEAALMGNCTVTLAGSPTAGSVAAGTSIGFTATGSCTSGTPEYQFMIKEPTGLYGVLRNWGAATATWDTTTAFRGLHKAFVKVRAQGMLDPYEGYSSNLVYTITDGRRYCTAGSVSPSVSSAAAGATVTLTATSTCYPGSPPEYKFMAIDPAGQYRTLRAWGTSATYSWDTTGGLGGAYTLVVFIRRVSSRALAGFEVKATSAFTLTGGAAYCGMATLTAAPMSLAAGASVSLTSTSTCSSGATAEYKFVDVQPTGRTVTLRDWGSSGSYSWSTSSATQTGNHQVRAYVRRSGSSLAYEDRSPRAVVIVTGGASFCTAASATFSPASTAAAGASVTITGSSTCPSAGEHRIVARAPDGLWRTISTWSGTASYTWDTSDAETGTYTFFYYSRLSGSSEPYEAYGGPYSYAITSGAGYCNAATISVSPASPQTAGATVTLSAGSTCTSGETAEYRYMARQPNNQWRQIEDWTSATSHAWDTTGMPTGSWTLYVYSRRSGSSQPAEGISSGQSYTLN